MARKRYKPEEIAGKWSRRRDVPYPPIGVWDAVAIAILIQNNSGPPIGLADRSVAG
jgi:hypothetical protein